MSSMKDRDILKQMPYFCDIEPKEDGFFEEICHQTTYKCFFGVFSSFPGNIHNDPNIDRFLIIL